jgi:hypothetical protein
LPGVEATGFATVSTFCYGAFLKGEKEEIVLSLGYTIFFALKNMKMNIVMAHR